MSASIDTPIPESAQSSAAAAQLVATDSAASPIRSNRFWQIAVPVILSFLFLEGLARVIAVVGQYNPVATDEFKTKRAIAEAPSQTPVVFFLGSSYTARTVYADLLTERLHQKKVNVEVRNLAMLGRGAAPQVQLQLLDMAIKAGAKPAAVLYDVSPLFGYLANREEKRLQIAPYIPYLFTYREKYGALLRALPGMLVAPESTSTGAFGVRAERTSQKGWDPRYDVVDRQSMTESLTLRRNLAWPERSSPQFFKMMEPVAVYCAKRRLPLILVWYPTTKASDAFFDKFDLSRDQFAQACGQTAQHWHAQFLDMHQELDPIYFCDCDHVNAAGACVVTEKLAQVLAEGRARAQERARTE